MSDHHGDGSLTLLAIGGGWLTEHVSHLVAGFPPGLIGPITTLLGGAILHVAAPYLRARGERLRDRALRRRSTVSSAARRADGAVMSDSTTSPRGPLLPGQVELR